MTNDTTQANGHANGAVLVSSRFSYLVEHLAQQVEYFAPHKMFTQGQALYAEMLVNMARIYAGQAPAAQWTKEDMPVTKEDMPVTYEDVRKKILDTVTTSLRTALEALSDAPEETRRQRLQRAREYMESPQKKGLFTKETQSDSFAAHDGALRMMEIIQNALLPTPSLAERVHASRNVPSTPGRG